jgi:hypothetical protein
MTYNEFLVFLDNFEEIKSFSGRIKAANDNLTRIGSGSGRAVYDIDGEKVLKLALNAKGVAQNEAESNIGQYHDTQHIVTKVFETSNDDTWIISEKAKKVNEKRIKELTDIPSLNDLYYYVRNFAKTNNGKNELFRQTPEMISYLNENEFAQDLTNLISNYSQQPGDFGRPSSYGEVLRGGQPTIVLTDYGLNDEVYDMYYNSAKKQNYRMYEMYNFADGNDDMLSDIGNTGEVRHGMWALIPQGVGDGDDEINEEFVKFIENRDKYPNKAVSGIPYIVDEFHNIVNNLNGVLNRVTDKRKFYNNLLELQNYLIRGKFYDREPLGELNEDGEVPNIEPMSLEKRHSDVIANIFAQKLNLGTPQYLGEGSYGHAYQINGNKVLKLTSDVSEAESGAKVKAAKPKTLVNVYNIYKIIDTEKGVALFALIEDFISNKPKELFRKYINVIDNIGGDNGSGFVDILMLMKRGKIGLDELMENCKFILSDKPEANILSDDREGAYRFIIGLIYIKKELDTRQIKSNDYGNPDNLGYKNNTLTYFDIGGNMKAQEPQLPQEDIIAIPENVEMDEDATSEFSTDNSVGRDDFPVYDNIDTSPSIQNDLNANSAIYEELEHMLTERIKSSMPGSSAVEVKKKCRLGGNGNTSTACNQGDMNNLNLTPIEEGVGNEYLHNKFGIEKPHADFERKYNAIKNIENKEEIITGHSSTGKEIEVIKNPKTLAHIPSYARGVIDNGGNIYVSTNAMDGSIHTDILDVLNSKNIVSLTPNWWNLLPTNFISIQRHGNANEFVIGESHTPMYLFIDRESEKLPSLEEAMPAFQSFLDKAKAKNPQYEFTNKVEAYYDIDLAELDDLNDEINEDINEEIDAEEAYDDNDIIPLMINGKKDVSILPLGRHPHLLQLVNQNGFGTIRVNQEHHNLGMHIVYRQTPKGKANAERLNQIMISYGGYVADKTPKEAYEIGKLLDYNDKSIMRFINRAYIKNPDGSATKRSLEQLYQYDKEHDKNGNPLVPEKTHADYNDLDENVNPGWFSGSQVVDNAGNPLIVYHGTNKEFTKFNLRNAAQPIIWFSSDRDKIERGESGAAGRSRIIQAYLSIKKMAGWNEYSKYGLGQLHDMGYDGAKLDDDYFVFNPKQVKIIKDKKNIDEDNETGKISAIWLEQMWNRLPVKHRNNALHQKWYKKALNGGITKKEWLHLQFLLKNGDTMYNRGMLSSNNESIKEDISMGNETYKKGDASKMNGYYENIIKYISLVKNKQYLSDEDMDNIMFYYMIMRYNHSVAKDVFGNDFYKIEEFIKDTLYGRGKIKENINEARKLMNII